MADVLYFNGRFTTTDERVIGVEDRGFQFGDAVYEVLKFTAKRSAFLPEHFARLQRSLEEMEIPAPFDIDDFRGIVGGLLERTSFDAGILYLQITRGEAERAHFWPEGLTPTVVAYTRRFVFPDEAKKERGIKVITMNELRWRRCDIKSGNLLGNAFAKKKAQRADADESLLVIEDAIVEGSSSNFFGVLEGRLLTSPLNEDLLPGVVRDRVVNLALESGIPLELKRVQLSEVAFLDEAFITSTTQGVMPVTTIDGRPVAAGKRGPLTQALQNAFALTEEASARGTMPEDETQI
jgi:D-alanine transaminase